jgi:hypothetical protein
VTWCCVQDGVVDQVYELLMNYLHVYSHTIAFPELVLPLTIQVRKFVKACKVANYTKQLKQIVDKVEEAAKVMTRREGGRQRSTSLMPRRWYVALAYVLL